VLHLKMEDHIDESYDIKGVNEDG